MFRLIAHMTRFPKSTNRKRLNFEEVFIFIRLLRNNLLKQNSAKEFTKIVSASTQVTLINETFL